MKTRYSCFVAAVAICFALQASALGGTKALNWIYDSKGITCVYGEIEVLCSIEGMYYCGAQFDQGYTGVQHLDKNLHTALFSVWDTSQTLKAKFTYTGPGTRPGRFGGEGTGAHVFIDKSWQIGKTYQYFLRKQPGKQAKTTDTNFWVVYQGKWQHVATINTPNGPKNVGTSFGGICSWIENIGGSADFSKPKVILYGLWVGSSPETLKHVIRSGGESGDKYGRWGQLHNTYFLAEGDAKNLTAFFTKSRKEYGEPTFGKDGKELPPIRDKPLPGKLIQELKKL